MYIFRTATARGKAELADMSADQAREDFEIARNTAKQFAPDFNLPSNCLFIYDNTPLHNSISNNQWSWQPHF